jgi:C1A family cysteine protease
VKTILAIVLAWWGALFTRRPKSRLYGRKGRDPKDTRDHRYVPKDEVLHALPGKVDMRSQDGPVFDQGQLGSCTANGWLGLFMFVCKKLFGDTFFGSRLQLYYDERAEDGTTGDDAGAYVRDGAKCLAEKGVCKESTWPYDISRFAEKPSDDCYKEALSNRIVEYMRVDQDAKHMKACLAEGFPFVFGFEVYESFESTSVSRTGIMPMPASGERVVGGHCVMAIGYVDDQGNAQFFGGRDRFAYGVKSFFSKLSNCMRRLTGLRILPVTPPAKTIICRNSWGTGWGDDGYFYMPIDFITNADYASDFWTVRQLTHKRAA